MQWSAAAAPLLCKLLPVDSTSVNRPPPPRYLTPTPLTLTRSVTLCPKLPKTARGVQKHNLTLGKGQISHSACLWALGTKATEFTSIKRSWLLSWGMEDSEWALHQTSPSWSALSGAAKRLAWRLFDWCAPAMSHARQRAHTHSHVYTLHLALNILPHASIQYP